jgi:hypothetical protein
MFRSLLRFAIITALVALAAAPAISSARADDAAVTATTDPNTSEAKAPFAPYGRETIWTGLVPLEPAKADAPDNKTEADKTGTPSTNN